MRFTSSSWGRRNEHPKHHIRLLPLRLPQVHGGGQYRTMRASRLPKNNGGRRSHDRGPLRPRSQELHSVHGQTARRSFHSQNWGPVMTPTQNTAGILSKVLPALRAAFLPVGRRITSPALVRPRRGFFLKTHSLGTLPSRQRGQHTFGKLTLGQPRRRNGALAGEGGSK